MYHITSALLWCIIFYVKNTNQFSVEANNNTGRFDRNSDESGICTTGTCIDESARMLNALDNSVEPCDDFYEFACGKLLRNTRLPVGKNSQTVFSEVQEIVDAQIKSILIANPVSNESNAINLANGFTRACINDDAGQNENGR